MAARLAEFGLAPEVNGDEVWEGLEATGTFVWATLWLGGEPPGRWQLALETDDLDRVGRVGHVAAGWRSTFDELEIVYDLEGGRARIAARQQLDGDDASATDRFLLVVDTFAEVVAEADRSGTTWHDDGPAEGVASLAAGLAAERRLDHADDAFAAALAILDGAGLDELAMLAVAGTVRSALARGDLATAQHRCDELRHRQEVAETGRSEPFGIWHATAFSVAVEADEPTRAAALLDVAVDEERLDADEAADLRLRVAARVDGPAAALVEIDRRLGTLDRSAPPLDRATLQFWRGEALYLSGATEEASTALRTSAGLFRVAGNEAGAAVADSTAAAVVSAVEGADAGNEVLAFARQRLEAARPEGVTDRLDDALDFFQRGIDLRSGDTSTRGVPDELGAAGVAWLIIGGRFAEASEMSRRELEALATRSLEDRDDWWRLDTAYHRALGAMADLLGNGGAELDGLLDAVATVEECRWSLRGSLRAAHVMQLHLVHCLAIPAMSHRGRHDAALELVELLGAAHVELAVDGRPPQMERASLTGDSALPRLAAPSRALRTWVPAQVDGDETWYWTIAPTAPGVFWGLVDDRGTASSGLVSNLEGFTVDEIVAERPGPDPEVALFAAHHHGTGDSLSERDERELAAALGRRLLPPPLVRRLQRTAPSAGGDGDPIHLVHRLDDLGVGFPWALLAIDDRGTRLVERAQLQAVAPIGAGTRRDRRPAEVVRIVDPLDDMELLRPLRSGDGADPVAFWTACGRGDALLYVGHGTDEGTGGAGLVLGRAPHDVVRAVDLLERDAGAPAIAVLAGCATARAAALEETGRWGFADAMLVAGADAVVATTSPITAGEVTRRMIERLAVGLEAGDDLAAVLRRAQLAELESVRGAARGIPSPAADWANWTIVKRARANR